MSFGTERWLVTRKAQTCIGCWRSQPAGARLKRWSFVDGDGWRAVGGDCGDCCECRLRAALAALEATP